MAKNNKSSKLKTKNESSPPLTPKSTSATPTTIASNTSSTKPKFEDLLEMISIQDSKIHKLTKRFTNLEQMLREAQSRNLIATNASELLKMEEDELKQYPIESAEVTKGKSS